MFFKLYVLHLGGGEEKQGVLLKWREYLCPNIAGMNIAINMLVNNFNSKNRVITGGKPKCLRKVIHQFD